MSPALTDAEVEHFRREGFVPPFRVVAAAEAQAWRQRLEAYEREHGGPVKGASRFKTHLLFKWQNDLIRHPKILDAVECLIGPDILVWSSDWWIKEPHSASFVSWHQDSQYWGLDTDKLVTAWIALSPATVASGCMRVLPGSHRGPDLTHRDTFHADNMLTRGQEIIDAPAESQTVNLEVDTGEATLFAFRIAHASPPNTTADRRIALAIRYVPPDARQLHAERDIAALVRGTDESGNFEHEPVPTRDFDPDAVAFHAYADAARRKILYQGTAWREHRT